MCGAGNAEGEQLKILSGFEAGLIEIGLALNETSELEAILDFDREEFERFLRELLESGEVDAEQLSKIAGIQLDPAQLSAMMQQFQQAASDSGTAVNWQHAETQATKIAERQARPIEQSRAEQIDGAFAIAQLWLSAETGLAATLEPKLLNRQLWVKDALPLFRELAEPVAESMSRALSENFGEMLPEQFQEMSASASALMRSAGSAMFAMQLGTAIGNLATEALSAGEIGIPATARPGLVVQNVEAFVADLGLAREELEIYLALRELALTSLFDRSSWLRDQLVTQVREFAAGIKIDMTPLQELGESFDAADPESMTRMLEVGALISPRTEEQQLALERIEALLALIEGWVESVCQRAGERLPSREAMAEAIRRRRAAGGAAEKTFATLLGLELRPRLLREAVAMWQRVTDELGPGTRDQLWSHPDQIPTVAELRDPELLLARLRTGADGWDEGLRNLLQ